MSGEVIIRQAREDEIPAVLELWQEIGVTPPSPSDSLEGLSALLREPQAVLLLAVIGDQIVGSVIGGWDGWRGNIYRLAVALQYRRRGIARLLVGEVSALLFAKGAQKISALVEHDHAWAIDFWESLRELGYQRDSRFARYLADRPPTAPVDTTRKRGKFTMPTDYWDKGEALERYVGRWSRLVAREFVMWLGLPNGASWIDVGCGPGALTEIILAAAAPKMVVGIDPSESYVAFAKSHIQDARATFRVGTALALNDRDATYDGAVAGLVLNFISADKAIAEMSRVTRPGGKVGAYVWDYADGMGLMRRFWDAAVALDPAAKDLDEGQRFPICQPKRLKQLFERGGLREIEVHPIDVPTVFRDFDDYWSPFLGGQGPAPGYVMSLSEEKRARLREEIRSSLDVEVNGSIHLMARAWAVKGRR